LFLLSSLMKLTLPAICIIFSRNWIIHLKMLDQNFQSKSIPIRKLIMSYCIYFHDRCHFLHEAGHHPFIVWSICIVMWIWPVLMSWMSRNLSSELCAYFERDLPPVYSTSLQIAAGISQVKIYCVSMKPLRQYITWKFCVFSRRWSMTFQLHYSVLLRNVELIVTQNFNGAFNVFMLLAAPFCKPSKKIAFSS